MQGNVVRHLRTDFGPAGVSVLDASPIVEGFGLKWNAFIDL
jgi:hypothetical protein